MSDKYASERGEPTGPTCSTANLLFDGSYLNLYLGETVVQQWEARSGYKVSGKFDYSVLRQLIPHHGPIPEGEYWIQPSQLREFWTDDDDWGVARITIHPRTATNTFSRGGFFIHGGRVYGSAGCIDLSFEMESFRNKIKTLALPVPGAYWGETTNNCTIPLTVKYSATSVDDV